MRVSLQELLLLLILFWIAMIYLQISKFLGSIKENGDKMVGLLTEIRDLIKPRL